MLICKQACILLKIKYFYCLLSIEMSVYQCSSCSLPWIIIIPEVQMHSRYLHIIIIMLCSFLLLQQLENANYLRVFRRLILSSCNCNVVQYSCCNYYIRYIFGCCILFLEKQQEISFSTPRIASQQRFQQQYVTCYTADPRA